MIGQKQTGVAHRNTNEIVTQKVYDFGGPRMFFDKDCVCFFESIFIVSAKQKYSPGSVRETFVKSAESHSKRSATHGKCHHIIGKNERCCQMLLEIFYVGIFGEIAKHSPNCW